MEIIKNRKYLKAINKYLFAICLLLSMLTFLLLWYNLQHKYKYNTSINRDILMLKVKHRVKPSFLPQQIHIAIGNENSQMVVVWSTRSNPQNQVSVIYGLDKNDLKFEEQGFTRLLDNNGWLQYINYVTLIELPPNTQIWYRCCSNGQCSEIYSFKSLPDTFYWKPRIALFGNLGLTNGKSISSLINNSVKGRYDVIFHMGDIACDMNGDNGRIGDHFLRRIEPFASRIPYMVIPGNREYECHQYCPSDNGNNYETRFRMPGLDGNDNSHYIIKLGRALFIVFSTEFYYEEESTYDSQLGIDKKYEIQREWLTTVLNEANLPENRIMHPWIITLAHRPLYCSSLKTCPNGMLKVSYTDNGNSDILELDLLFKKFGVDISFWGHEHYYERLWPLFNKTVFRKGTQRHQYNNPEATIHITSGSAGNLEKLASLQTSLPDWSAVQRLNYGYTRMIVNNATHIYIEQIDVENNDKVVDYVWIIKHKFYGSFNSNNSKV